MGRSIFILLTMTILLSFIGILNATYIDESIINNESFNARMTTIFEVDPVIGNITYAFVEQGWTIKVKGALDGHIDGDTLIATSTTPFKYAGITHHIVVNIDAVKVDDAYKGTKTLSLDGTFSRTMPFEALLE